MLNQTHVLERLAGIRNVRKVLEILLIACQEISAKTYHITLFSCFVSLVQILHRYDLFKIFHKLHTGS